MRQVFRNLAAVAEAAGASLHDAVRVGAYLSDMAHFDTFDRVYRELFVDPLPARTTIQTDLGKAQLATPSDSWPAGQSQ